MTPAGAIILHWVFAVVWIIATPNTSDGYGFVIGLFIYGQLIVGGKHKPSVSLKNPAPEYMITKNRRTTG